MGEAKKRRCKARVEGGNAFLEVHFAKGVKGACVVPWRPVFGRCAGADLGHESCLDDPYGISD